MPKYFPAALAILPTTLAAIGTYILCAADFLHSSAAIFQP
ncbi:MAG: hypothetical protein JWQ23_3750 [Herminiimonas sp.]|nr:hypothetical protein [Herminiimonas sp.]